MLDGMIELRDKILIFVGVGGLFSFLLFFFVFVVGPDPGPCHSKM